MLENYEINLKMTAIWVLVIFGIAGATAAYLQSSESSEESLTIWVSDETPVERQDIDLEILAGSENVQASTVRINGEEYSQVSSFTYTVPQGASELIIEAEYQGMSAEKIIEVRDSAEEPDSDDTDQASGDSSNNYSSQDVDEENQEDTSQEDAQQGSDNELEDQEDQDQVSEKDQKEYNINLIRPENNQVFETTDRALVNFSFEISDNSVYRLRIDNNLYSSGEAGGEVNLTEQLSPGKYEWFVRGIKDQQIFDSEIREFEVKERASANINMNQSTVDGYILDLYFSVGNAENYRVLIDSETVDEASTSFSEFYRYEFETSGDHIVEVQALRNNEVVASTSRTFSSEAPPNAQINWVKPTSPADTTTPETEFQVDTDAEYNLVYTINEGASATDFSYWEASGTGTQSFSFTPDPLPQGEHDYSIEVRDEHQTVIGEGSGTFETTAQRGFLQVNNKEYLYDSGEDRHLIRLDLKAYENLSYDISVNGSIVAEESISGTNVQTSVDIGNLQSGQDYTAEILFESDESSQNLTENLSFTAQ